MFIYIYRVKSMEYILLEVNFSVICSKKTTQFDSRRPQGDPAHPALNPCKWQLEGNTVYFSAREFKFHRTPFSAWTALFSGK